MSWAACDRLGNIAEQLGLDGARHALARARRRRSARRSRKRPGTRQDKRFAATFGGDELDASLLQLLDMRFLEPDDPRFLATFNAVEKGLRRGEHMLRYAAEDDFGLPETAFNFCTFWLIEALHLVGRTRRSARPLREDARTADPGGPAFRGHRLRNAASCGATIRRLIRLSD